MSEEITVYAGGRELKICGSVASYLNSHNTWNADAAMVYGAAKNLPHGSTIIDAGANIGLITTTLAAQRPDCKIIAIEPVPDNVDCLRRNVETNGLTNVEVIHAAVSDKEGFVSISNNGPWSSISEDAEVKVRCITLDSFSDQKIGFVKIDTEGHEPYVLAGARKIFAESKPIVHMEFNLWWLIMRHYDLLTFTNAIWASSEMLGVYYLEEQASAPSDAATFLNLNITSHQGLSDLLFRPHSALPSLQEMTLSPEHLRLLNR